MRQFYDLRTQVLLDRNRRSKITVSVVGAGQVGFRTCMAFGGAGYSVVALDVDKGKVDKINSKIVPIEGEDIGNPFESCDITASTDIPKVCSESDAIIVCVPTPLKGDTPDTSFVISAVTEIAKGITPGSVIVFESTVYPGTIENELFPILEKAGIRPGEDIGVAYSPERVDPGNKVYTIENIPRVMGGINEKSLNIAKALYETSLNAGIVPVSNIKTAETVKLLENTFRDVNIAFANEIAMLLDGTEIDVSEVIRAAGTKPFAFMPHYPGPGVGGDCIPVSPRWLMGFAKSRGRKLSLVETARHINDSMPLFVATKLESRMKEAGKPISGSGILVLGLTYKPGVNDTRHSPSKKIIELLKARGANVRAYDTMVSEERVMEEFGVEYAGLDTISEYDAVVLVTPHKEIMEFVSDIGDKAKEGCIFFDTRNSFTEKNGRIVHIGVGRL